MGSDTDADGPHRAGDEAPGTPPVPVLAPADARRWQQVFSGEERQLGLMRRWLTACLPDCPARDDVVSVATELSSNAILHTASGRGGWFAVELTWCQFTVRVAVADHGGQAEPHVIEDPDGEHGRGLLLVHGLSARTGVTGNERGRTVWAEIAWDGPPRDAGLASVGPGEVEIREDTAALARRFAGVPVWFGRATRAWWALAGPSELVTAPTAPELAALLYRRLNTPPRPRSAAAARSRQRTAARRPGLGDAFGYGSAPGARPGPDPRARYRADRDGADGSPPARGRGQSWPSAAWSRSAALPGA
jgi:histidine kinase-like protein